jgi:hypothetical protein
VIDDDLGRSGGGVARPGFEKLLAARVSIEGGRKKIVRGFRKERKDWEVLIQDHHEGYLNWADYERNLGLIADNGRYACRRTRRMGRHRD